MKTKTVMGVNINLDAITNMKELKAAKLFDNEEQENAAGVELGFIKPPKEDKPAAEA